MQRRHLAAGVSLLALASCASISSALSTSTEAGINQAIAIAQGVLNYLGPVVPLVAAFIPGAAVFVAPAMAAITLASQLLNTLTQTMAAVDAQPIVGKVTAALGGLLTAADQALALVTDPTQKAQIQAVTAAARGELALLSQLAANIQMVIASPPVSASIRMMGQHIVVPPIFVRSAA